MRAVEHRLGHRRPVDRDRAKATAPKIEDDVGGAGAPEGDRDAAGGAVARRDVECEVIPDVGDGAGPGGSELLGDSSAHEGRVRKGSGPDGKGGEQGSQEMEHGAWARGMEPNIQAGRPEGNRQPSWSG